MSNEENKLEVSGLKVEVFRNTGGNNVRVIVKAGFLLTEEVVSQRFLDFTKLSIKPVLFRGQYPKQDIDPYKWNTLAENYKIVLEDVSNEKGFLNIRKGSILPFNIRGRTDVILVERSRVEGNALRPGIHAIFELKKIVAERDVRQAILEMIIADCFVNKDVKVIGVLTDLKNVWNIF
ncbi:unnamed protein product [Rhizophagus irregularis]|nr:unnamed protein product [Rhizophagus irregularis]